MKDFQQWCELNYSATQARQGISNSVQDYGSSWKGLQEVKDLLELLAQYDISSFNTVVSKIKLEINQLLRSKGVENDADAQRMQSLSKIVATDARRFASRAQRQGEQE